jgi:hypothetical protein
MHLGPRFALPGPRARRRIAWAFRGVLVVVGATIAVWLIPTVAFAPPAPIPPSPQAGSPAWLPAEPAPHMRVTPALRKELAAVAEVFIDTAVRRVQTGRSWALVHPSLRQGFTRAKWQTGNIPVVPFPAERALGLKIDDAREDDVLMEVVLVPQRGSGVMSKTFQIELRRVAEPSRWLVAAWVPLGISGAQMARDAEARGDNSVVVRSRNLSDAWLLLPLAILSLTILVPVSLVLVHTLEDRRAFRRYAEETRPVPSDGRDATTISRPS